MKILETMAELTLMELYPKILRDGQIDAIGPPKIEITKLAAGNPFSFKITAAIYPKFTLPDYRAIAKKINAERVNPEPLSEKEIDEFLAAISKDGQNAPAREKVRESLEQEKRRAARDKQRLKIIEAVLIQTDINPPDILIESELGKMLEEMKNTIIRLGGKFEDYLTHIKKTETDLKTEWRETAVKRVRASLILDRIGAAEKIQPPAERVEKETELFLARYKNAAPERARAYFSHRLAAELIWDLLEQQR